MAQFLKGKDKGSLLPEEQYDQMAIIFTNIWPFLAMKFCPIAQNICQHWVTICQNTPQKIAKDFENVVKSGHSAGRSTTQRRPALKSSKKIRSVPEK